MHEAARHAIHSFEILSVSVDTLQALQQEMIDLSSKRMQTNRESADASLRIRVRTGSQIRILRNLLLRAQSNKERLQNEIALVGKISVNAKLPANAPPGIQSSRSARQSGDQRHWTGRED